MTFREIVSNVFTNWADSDLPLPKRSGVLVRNAARRLRGKPCCGHPGEPGC